MVLLSFNSYLQTDKNHSDLQQIQNGMQKRMKAFRKLYGLQLEDAEKLLDGKGSTSTWKRLEYNSKHFPSVLTAYKIACIMGISVSELLSPLENEK